MNDLPSVIREQLRRDAERAPRCDDIEATVLRRLTEHRRSRPIDRHRRLPYLTWVGVAVGALVIVVSVVIFSESREQSSTDVTAVEGQVALSTSGWRPGDNFREMGIGGTLRISEDGCVYLAGSSGGVIDLVWPAGWTARSREGGEIQILDDHGDPVAQTGQQIATGGGEYDGDVVCRAPGSTGVVSVESRVAIVK